MYDQVPVGYVTSSPYTQFPTTKVLCIWNPQVTPKGCCLSSRGPPLWLAKNATSWGNPHLEHQFIPRGCSLSGGWPFHSGGQDPSPSWGTLHVDQRVIPAGCCLFGRESFSPDCNALLSIHPFSLYLVLFWGCRAHCEALHWTSPLPWSSRVKDTSLSNPHIHANQKMSTIPIVG